MVYIEDDLIIVFTGFFSLSLSQLFLLCLFVSLLFFHFSFSFYVFYLVFLSISQSLSLSLFPLLFYGSFYLSPYTWSCSSYDHLITALKVHSTSFLYKTSVRTGVHILIVSHNITAVVLSGLLQISVIVSNLLGISNGTLYSFHANRLFSSHFSSRGDNPYWEHTHGSLKQFFTNWLALV